MRCRSPIRLERVHTGFEASVSREAAKNAKRREFRGRQIFLEQRPYKAFPFAFFAASRETNLLSKSAPNAGCTRLDLRMHPTVSRTISDMQSTTRPSAPPLLWIIAVTSLILNLALIGAIAYGVFAGIGIGRTIAGTAADQLEAFGSSTFSTTVRVQHTINIDTSVPFEYADTISIDQVVPIKTTVAVAQEFPIIGILKFDVPIDTSVPISVSVPIRIERRVPISLSVPIDFTVPVAVQLKDTPVKPQIDAAVNTLRELQKQ